MANLSTENIGTNYKGILNLGSTINTPLSTTLQDITDGDGNASPLKISTQRIALGVATGTGLLNFPDAGTTAADGISFGSNISLFRTGSEAIRLNSSTFEMFSPTANRVSHVLSSGGRFRLINNIGGGITFFDFDSGAGSSIIDYGQNSFQFKASSVNRFEISSTGGQVNITPPTLTGSSATSALSITQTHNTTGSPDVIKVDVTNTASGANTRFLNFYTSGVSQFSIDRIGNFYILNNGSINHSSGSFTFNHGGTQYFRGNSLGVLIGTGFVPTSAMLSVTSTTQGFLPPRMTTAQKNAIASPAAGLMVYDTTLNQMSYYNGTAWVNF